MTIKVGGKVIWNSKFMKCCKCGITETLTTDDTIDWYCDDHYMEKRKFRR